MRRLAGWALMALAVGCGVTARADDGTKKHGAKQAKVERWKQVEGLQPGAEIDVLAGSQAGPDRCLVASVDDSALTCVAEDAMRGGRLVFPRSAVRDVWVFEDAPNRHIGLWIGLAVSAALEISACVAGGAAGGMVVGAIIAVGWAAAAAVENLIPGPIWFPGPPRPVRQPERRRLVYSAALDTVAP